MIGSKWDHEALNAMSEKEFCWWRDQQQKMDELKAEAIEKAAAE